MPRLRSRAEVFEVMDDFKYEGLDIGDAYDEIYNIIMKDYGRSTRKGQPRRTARRAYEPKKKRKLSAWNKFVKANSKKPRFRYRNGKLNLKKMAVAFRKTKKRGGR